MAKNLVVPQGDSSDGNVPVALAEGVQAELVCDLSSVHGIGEILLVGEHQQHSVAQLVLHRDRLR